MARRFVNVCFREHSISFMLCKSSLLNPGNLRINIHISFSPSKEKTEELGDAVYTCASDPHLKAAHFSDTWLWRAHRAPTSWIVNVHLSLKKYILVNEFKISFIWKDMQFSCVSLVAKFLVAPRPGHRRAARGASGSATADPRSSSTARTPSPRYRITTRQRIPL